MVAPSALGCLGWCVGAGLGGGGESCSVARMWCEMVPSFWAHSDPFLLMSPLIFMCGVVSRAPPHQDTVTGPKPPESVLLDLSSLPLPLGQCWTGSGHWVNEGPMVTQWPSRGCTHLVIFLLCRQASPLSNASRVSSQHLLICLLCILSRESAEDGLGVGRGKRKGKKNSTPALCKAAHLRDREIEARKRREEMAPCPPMLISWWKGDVKDGGCASTSGLGHRFSGRLSCWPVRGVPPSGTVGPPLSSSAGKTGGLGSSCREGGTHVAFCSPHLLFCRGLFEASLDRSWALGAPRSHLSYSSLCLLELVLNPFSPRQTDRPTDPCQWA